MIKSFLFLCLLIPALGFAQDADKYLAGKVPVVNGLVVFSEEIKMPSVSKEQIYDVMLKWVESRFKDNNKDNWGRVLFSDKEKGQIVCQGNEYIVFTQKSLVLDRAKINYRLTLLCVPGSCEIKISNIYYLYEDRQDKLNAEDWITDEAALNKKKTKLTYGCKKFRVKTIDLVDSLFEDAQNALNANVVNYIKPTPTPVPPVRLQTNSDIPVISGDALQGYKKIAPDKIPGNIIKILPNDWSLITTGNKEKFNMMTASWGGLGYFADKPVAFSFISPKHYTYELMEKNDTYTISFYTETYRDILTYCGTHSGRDADKAGSVDLTPLVTPAGSHAFSEAWMIIECKKMISQPITPESVSTPFKKDWTDKQLPQMFIGEIINVWVK